jgi:hypothetical protein
MGVYEKGNSKGILACEASGKGSNTSVARPIF